MAPGRCVVCAAVLVAGCAGGPRSSDDRGPIEASLEPGDRVHWPGVDTASGRLVPLVRNFGNGRPSAYWFLGFADRRTSDSFWFCREGDDGCPLDEHRRIAWDRLVGRPMFSTIPGQPGFSHWWVIWVVRVSPGYEPDTIKTIGSLFDADALDEVRVEPLVLDFPERGPQETLMHCAMVLQGTELEGNGGPMPDGSGPMLRVERHEGWRQGYRVQFFDMTPVDGVFPEADDSVSRPLMPFANIYVLWRRCDGEPRPSICDIPGLALPDRRAVSERGLGQDITGDGDTRDTNNVVGALQCEQRQAGEPAYSPLWAVQASPVEPSASLRLIDSYGEQTRTDVASARALREAVDAGLLEEPAPQAFDSSGRAVEGAERQVFFNCPTPVPEGFVPHPCPKRP